MPLLLCSLTFLEGVLFATDHLVADALQALKERIHKPVEIADGSEILILLFPLDLFGSHFWLFVTLDFVRLVIVKRFAKHLR